MKLIRFLSRFLLSFLISLTIVVIVILISGNGHLIKAVQSTYLIGKTGPSIDDYKKFSNRTVANSSPESWSKSAHFNTYSTSSKEDSIFNYWESVSFLIVQNDSLLFEKYWDNYSQESYSNSFSVAKSLVGLSIGAAIQDGCIESLDQKVGDFLNEFREGEKAKISIRDLLQMSSGIDFGESYGDPFGFMAKTYYGDELYELTINKEVKYGPSEIWKYQGGNSLLLSFIIKKACGKSLSDFFSEKIWKSIGANKEALWTINDEGQERAYCCFYSNARDFAKVGKLILDSGQWNGRQLIKPSFYLEMFQPVNIKDENGKLIDYYSLHWWLTSYKENDVFYARGIQGQYIVVIPSWNSVMVRLGHKRDPDIGAEVPIDLIDYLEFTEKVLMRREGQ